MDGDVMKDLVEASKRQNTDAFAKLYEMIYQDMYKYAYYMLANEQDTEDIVADTVMTAFESIKKLKDSALFRSWIFKILSNKCKMKRKQYAKQHAVIAWHRADTAVKGKETAAQEVDYAGREVLKKAFLTLTEEEQAIVSAYIFGGFKGEEIAAGLGLKHSTVRSKYRRSLQKLQKELDIGGVI